MNPNAWIADAIFGFFNRFGFNTESINRHETKKKRNKIPPSIILSLGIIDMDITPNPKAINNTTGILGKNSMKFKI